MTDADCATMRLLVQADVDGELTPADAAGLAAHLQTCRACATLQAELIALSARVRQGASRFAAPDDVRAQLRARIAAVSAPATVDPVPIRPARRHLAAPFGAGFALAACLAWALLMPRPERLSEDIVADHIRALQPGHLMDVVSTDQHTVKPWFDGRLDFAPPVKDFAAAGFPLAGGRLDYLAGQNVAALVYQRRQHLIDLFVWPDPQHRADGPAEGVRAGYHFVHWNEGEMTLWAVSDVNADELADFVRLWRGS